jgi:SNF2 family DNA or RNA helicase
MPHAQAEIQEQLSDLCTTVELPFAVDKPIVSDVTVTLGPASRRLYRELEREMFVKLAGEEEITAVNAAVLTGKCQQFANGAMYIPDRPHEWAAVHDEKLDALASIIEEAAGAPVLVAYQFQSDADRIMGRFAKARRITERGAIDDWNAGKVPLMLMHPASAGHGLNLQHGGNIIVWFGLPWSLELYEQAIERVGPLRQMQSGLNRPCYVYRIVAADTVDDLIAERLTGKRTVQEILLDAMKHRC